MARTMTDEQENESRAALTYRARVAELEANTDALRDALESGNRRLGYWCDLHGSLPEDVSALAGMQAALASTPAADLAAHDAEVRKSVLMEAATWFEGSGEPIGKATAQFIRALAAQEVKK